MVITDLMNILDLTPTQLKRAATIKEQVEKLNKELHGILGVSTNSAGPSPKNRTMSASVKKKIAATQTTRWANLRLAKSGTRSAQPAVEAKKKTTMSPAARAKLSAKLKAYWAAKKTGKK
jgi:hypothetical protein